MRAASRATDRAARATTSSPPPSTSRAAAPEPVDTRRGRGLAITRRAVAVVVVLFILLFSYLNSLRVYFRQQQQMATAQVEIQQRQRAIEQLEDEKARWQDPDYVKAQARSRLGWVMPGEVGYKVIGADGKPLGQGSELENESDLPSDEHRVWWERMIGSIKTADDPIPTDQAPTAEPTVKASTPAPSPSPSR
ncbi:septum formation initiator family protein [Tessaracoccus sp. SD287]|uniref:FtsB family cell division protein n=1 Tax=Tessaracoccus sp. SD287 TaxID=2782008 RepID=UPI00351C665F